MLNTVIGKKSGPTSLPSHFVNENNKKIDNMNEVANEFNDFFVNVGPKLAETIGRHNDGAAQTGWRGESRVLQSMHLGEVSKNDISIVNKLKNKTSTDNDGLDMIIIKKTLIASLILFAIFLICHSRQGHSQIKC